MVRKVKTGAQNAPQQPEDSNLATIAFPTPNEVEARRHRELTPWVKELADAITELFTRQPGPKYVLALHDVFTRPDRTGQLPEFALQRVIFDVVQKKLQEAGWVATWHDDQRDGSYICIVPATYSSHR
jgi:hypothetical protein